jgi:methionyl-tRNA synthetase
MREVSFGNDGNVGHDGLQRRMNTDLANDFGNLAQRVLAFIYKNADATLPTIGDLTAEDNAMLDMCGTKLLNTCRKHIDAQEFHLMLEAVWVAIRAANVYVDVQAPWALRKTDIARMNTVLGVLCEVVRRTAILCQPVMPTTMAKMLDQLAVPQNARTFAHVTDAVGLAQGIKIDQPAGVFPRYAPPAAVA